MLTVESSMRSYSASRSDDQHQINKELKTALNNVGDGDSGDEVHHDDHPIDGDYQEDGGNYDNAGDYQDDSGEYNNEAFDHGGYGG